MVLYIEYWHNFMFTLIIILYYIYVCILYIYLELIINALFWYKVKILLK